MIFYLSSMGQDVFSPLNQYNLSDKYSRIDYKQYIFPDKIFEFRENDLVVAAVHSDIHRLLFHGSSFLAYT